MLKVDRRLIENFDWITLFVALMLCVTGIMTIFSATRPLPGGVQPSYYIKQIYWLMAGLSVMTVVVAINYDWFRKYSYYLYTGCLVMLVLVSITGHTGMGAQRWIRLGPLLFQPSELFKLVFVITIARYFSAFGGAISTRSMAIAFFGLALIPLVLVLKQPDLGTTIVIFMLFVGMALMKGLGRRFIVLAVLFCVVSVPFLGNIVWDELKPYQKRRIITFIVPQEQSGDLGYHVQQSKVAVGSGGAAGKGYLKGTQGPFRFLPEKHTDFVFAVFAEEWGFAGCMVLLTLYLTLILRAIHTAMIAKDLFGRLVSMGIAMIFTIYCFVNIGMTVGLAPVVGIPLPFMSYGGTAMVTNFMAVGLLINIRARRFELFY